MEAFLHFWNSHDTVIIQMLVVVILLMVIFLSLRFLFSKDHKDHVEAINGVGVSSGAAGAVSVEIESVLQKILENQSHAQALSGQGGSSNPAEVVALQGEVQKRQERVKDLEKEVADLQAEMANNAKKAAGLDPVVLKETVTRLESRLSEYEIISEDIADLSFYKEENVRLQAELAKMKMAPPPAAVSAPASVEVSQVVEQPTQEAAPASDDDAASTSIDDDIMAQFAAAVEEQKAAKAAKNMAPPVQKPQVDGELMGQFEEFVKKG